MTNNFSNLIKCKCGKNKSYKNEYCDTCFVKANKDSYQVPHPDSIGTKALKFDTDKPRMELLDPYALEQIALVMTFGARKYADENWRNGFKWKRLLGAAMRHLTAFIGGQDKDPETGLSHIAHLGCCVMFLLWHERNKPEFDDRYKGQNQDKLS